MGKGSQGVAIAGVAILSGFIAVVLTVVALVLFHQAGIFLSSCAVSPSGRQYACTPQTWKWVLTVAGVLGAGVGAVVASLVFRHQTRSHDKAAPPVGQLSDCTSSRRFEWWR
jgi:hypothetical protein